MVLRKLIAQKLIDEVIRNGQTGEDYKNNWRVLVVDDLTLKIVSAVKKMHELSAEGIIQVKNGLGFEKKFRIDHLTHKIDTFY